MERPRILLADDHADSLAMAKELIESQAEFDVVMTCCNGQDAVDQAELWNPDIIVLDISMPGLTGIEAAKRLSTQNSKVVFLTVHDDADYLQCALATGAIGYVVKDRLATDLMPALRSAVAGRQFISNTLELRRISGAIT